jgi:hypothetical protein
MSRVEIAFGEGLRMKLVTRDLRIVVSDSHGKVGELAISKGPVDWWPRDAKNSYRLPWTRFDKVMQENGRKGPLRSLQPVKARKAVSRRRSPRRRTTPKV